MNNEEKNIPKALLNPNPEGNNYYGNRRKREEESDNKTENSLPKKDGLDDQKKEKDNKKSPLEMSGAEKKLQSKAGEAAGNALGGPLGGLLGKQLGKLNFKKIKLYMTIAAIAIGAFIIFFVFAYLAFAWNTFMTSVVSFFGIKEGEMIETESTNTVQNMSTNNNATYDYEGLWYEYVNLENEQPIGLHDYEYPDGTTEEGLITMLKKDEACRNTTKIAAWFGNLWTTITGQFGKNDPCRLLNYIWGKTEGYESTFAEYGLNIDENMIIATIFYGYDQQAFYTAYKNPEEANFVSASNMYDVLLNVIKTEDENGKPILVKEDVDKIIKNTIYEDIWPYWVFDIITRYRPTMNCAEGSVCPEYKFAQCFGDPTEYWKRYLTNRATAYEYVNELIDGCAASFAAEYGGSAEMIKNGNPEAFRNMIAALSGGKNFINMKVPLQVGICRARSHVSYYYEPTKLETFLRFNNTTNLNTNEEFGDYGITGCMSKNAWRCNSFNVNFNIPETLTGSYVEPTKDGSGTYWLGLAYEQNKMKYYNPDSFYGYGMTYDENMNKSWLNSSPACTGAAGAGDYAVDYMEEREGLAFDGISVGVARKFFSDRNYVGASSSSLEAGPVPTFLYTQRINNEDLYTLDEIEIADIGPRRYCLNASCGENKTNAIYEINYEKGFAFEEFPGFKMASEDTNIDESILTYKWDDMSTPKKVEALIQNINYRKKEFAEVLQTGLDPYPCDTNAKNKNIQFPFCKETNATNNRSIDEPDYEELEKNNVNIAREVVIDTKAYCDILKTDYVGQYQVIITDCEGNYITSTSFKEYIMGVTYAEIGFVKESSLDDYVKTQMVAAISYTLGRHKNYKNKTFVMKSGSCDQNWCDIFKGCSRTAEGGHVRANGEVLLVTLPGTHNKSTTFLDCTMKDYTAKNYWKCPMTTNSSTSGQGGMNENQLLRYSLLFDEAVEYYVVAKGTDIFFGETMEALANSTEFNGAYTVVQHETWLAKAKAGMDFVSILRETYPESVVLHCDMLEEKGTCVNYNTNFDAQWNAAVLEAASILANDKKPILPDMQEDNRGGEDVVGDCSTFVRTAVTNAIDIYKSGFTSSIPPYKDTVFPPGTLANSDDIINSMDTSSTYQFKDYGRCNCSYANDIRPGDIVFHRTNSERWGNIGHVAIFAGYDEQGRQLVYETNTKAVVKANEKLKGEKAHIPALVVDNNTNLIAGYSRWYPPSIGLKACEEKYD